MSRFDQRLLIDSPHRNLIKRDSKMEASRIKSELEPDFEVHAGELLAKARGMLDASGSHANMAGLFLEAVRKNEEWRGERCINLLRQRTAAGDVLSRRTVFRV
jgi:hypothetical protein